MAQPMEQVAAVEVAVAAVEVAVAAVEVAVAAAVAPEPSNKTITIDSKI
jgi:hypothetical protein